MSYNNGPKIITEGLEYMFDPALKKCYDSGTSYNNLVISNNIDGEFNVTPTVDYTDARGAVDFSAATNHMEADVGIFNANRVDFTWSFWMKRTAALPASFHEFFLCYTRTGSNDFIAIFNAITIGIYVNETLYMVSTDVSTILDLDEWVNITFVINLSSDRYFIYKNGVLLFTRTGVTQSIPSQTGFNTITLFGDRDSSTDYNQEYTGKFSVVKFYSRILNQSEIKQNFNALKGRFGY